MRPPCLALAICGALVWAASARAAGPVDVVFARESSFTQSLNGDWRFKYVPSSDLGTDAAFFEASSAASTAAAAWKTIPVPSNWEMHGFSEPKYGRELVEGTGLYRTTFRVKESWRGRRVFVRFDGVLYGLRAWVNGKPVGEWASAYNPATFDVTDALLAAADAENVLAVEVSTRVKGWEFDTNDCWSLSGIYRDVTLFSTPQTYVADVTVRTTLKPNGAADVSAAVMVSDGTATVSGKLIDPSGKLVGEFPIAIAAGGKGEGMISVAKPSLWTAETPSLYQLVLESKLGGVVAQTVHERIGIRQITIEDAVLKLNGTPIKLRGVDHHDIWPDVGRAASEEDLVRDLALIRDGNMNFVRTSHYPAHPLLAELCDEMGIYVMCEVPFGYGDEHLNDASYGDILLTRARATVMRDKNHPSVIVWSIGNENPITDIGLAAGKRVKELDPTRPICFPQVGSYFARNYEKLPEWVDIYAPHYPVVSTVRDYAAKLTRPVIFTEYAHALGLATDRIEAEWEIMASSARLAGGAVWMFQDQGILRRDDHRVFPSGTTNYAWTDAHHYFDTHNLDGCDGLVYSDRTPQTDYWVTRKAYAPVSIAEREFTVRTGRQEIALHVENRFDFRSLAGVTLAWSLVENGIARDGGTRALGAAAKNVETVSIPVLASNEASSGVLALELRCLDENGKAFYERSVRLHVEGEKSFLAQVRASAAPVELKMIETGDTFRVVHPRFEVRVDRNNGRGTLLDHVGRTLALGPYVQFGRPMTMAEDLRGKNGSIWKDESYLDQSGSNVVATRVADGILITQEVKRPREDKPAERLEGQHSLLVRKDGTIEVSYDYKPVGATGTMLEAGVAFIASGGDFRWIGQGPFAGFPGKERLNEFGIFHLDREDLRFSGNRRGVELAVLSDRFGAGVAIVGEPMDLGVTPMTGACVLSHNALISGRGNKGVGPESPLNADKIERIAGHFTLVPLDREWPAPLVRWFGQPTAPATVLHPFYHSYDQ